MDAARRAVRTAAIVIVNEGSNQPTGIPCPAGSYGGVSSPSKKGAGNWTPSRKAGHGETDTSGVCVLVGRSSSLL